MLDVRMLTKRWYKLWSFQKDFFKKKKGKKKLYTEKKKRFASIFCVLFQTIQWVTIVSDFEKWRVELEC